MPFVNLTAIREHNLPASLIEAAYVESGTKGFKVITVNTPDQPDVKGGAFSVFARNRGEEFTQTARVLDAFARYGSTHAAIAFTGTAKIPNHTSLDAPPMITPVIIIQVINLTDATTHVIVTTAPEQGHLTDDHIVATSFDENGGMKETDTPSAFLRGYLDDNPLGEPHGNTDQLTEALTRLTETYPETITDVTLFESITGATNPVSISSTRR